MTEEELKIIEERANAATQGPWIPKHDKTAYLASGEAEHEVRAADGRTIYATIGKNEDEEARINTLFIAHAREDIPALIAEIRRLRLKLEK